MPKLFPIHIEVEELAVGKVMRLLNGMPGIAKLNLDLERKAKPAKPNGVGTGKGSHRNYGEPAWVAVERALFEKGATKQSDLRDMLVAQGRAATSINSVMHDLRKEGSIKQTPQGFVLTKKRRDTLRHRKDFAKRK